MKNQDKTFKNEPSEESAIEAYIYSLAVYYNYKCEAFDRIICSKIDNEGFGVPINYDERRAINAYATNLHKTMQYARYNHASEFRKQSHIAQRMTWEQLKTEYDRLFGEGKQFENRHI